MPVSRLGWLCNRLVELVLVLLAGWRSQSLDGDEILSGQDESRTQHELHCPGLSQQLSWSVKAGRLGGGSSVS